MKIVRVFQLVVLLLSTSAVIAQKKPSYISGGKYQHDLTTEGLKGSVKSATSYSYYAKQDSDISSKNWDYKIINEYNKKGNLVSTSYKKSSRSVETYHLNYKYDGHGRTDRLSNQNGQVIRRFDYAYNIKRNLVETSSSGSRLSYHLVYNRNGKRDTLYNYDRKGEVTSKQVFRYDDDGNLIQFMRYNPEGNVTNKHFYRYDNQHNKTEEIIADARGERKSRISFKYDDKGNLTSRLDSNLFFIGGDPGKKVGDQLYLRTYSYVKFDHAGNWLQKNLMIDNQIKRIVVREIEYY